MNIKKMLPWVIAAVAIYLGWDKIKGMLGMDKPGETTPPTSVAETGEIIDNTLA